MNNNTNIFFQTDFNVTPEAMAIIKKSESEIITQFNDLDEICLHNQAKVLSALQKEQIALRHFAPTTGYGYDDIGRDALDRVFAAVFCTEDALVRPHFASGTHAIALALYGVLMPGDRLACICGMPYDTLHDVIGITGQEWGSLKHYGIGYDQIDLMEDGSIDFEGVKRSINKQTKVIYIQRSRGYAWRPALKFDGIAKAIAIAKDINPQIIAIVDNCYGEFTNYREPSEAGADILAGSLIKNPGGGIAPTGGYIAGKSELIAQIANRMTAPGIGREVGSYVGSYAPFFQGLFLAPQAVKNSLKGAILAAKVFAELGFDTMPLYDHERNDIIQAVRFGSADALIQFCRSIQKASPVDSFVIPEPWDMPGYQEPVIMAAGSFIQGSSIELSADAPIREPYTAYMQGGLTYEHVKIALMTSISEMMRNGLLP